MERAVQILGSKSEAQRAILLGSVFGAEIHGLGDCEDVQAAISVANGMGAKMQDGIVYRQGTPTFSAHVGASATSFRMGIPLMLAQYGQAHFYFDEQLAKRPMDDFFAFFKANSITYELEEQCLHCYGKLFPGTHYIKGGISSQYLSGLLLALASLKEQSIVYYDSIASFSYINITIETLRNFGIIVEHLGNRITIDARNTGYANLQLRADWSSAVPFLAAKALGHSVQLLGNFTGEHPDRAFLKILEKIGYEVENVNKIRPLGLKPLQADCDAFPDLAPFLALVLTQVEGESVLYNVGRLQFKECDRFHTTQKILSSLGANIVCGDNAWIIQGKKQLWEGGLKVDCKNDHRMVMLAAIAQLQCKKPLFIQDKMAVSKSFPNFWEEYAKIEVKHEHLG